MTKGFAQIPNEVLTDNNLSVSEKVVYAIILGKYKQKGYCWVSNKTFAENTGKTIRHIRRIINSLEEKKYIKVKLDYTKTVTERQLTPLVVVEKQEDILSTTRRTCMSSNNTLSLKRKRANKKSDDFYSQWTPLSCTGTEQLKVDTIYRATNGLYDSATLKQECKFRWPEVSPEKTELYQQVLKSI
jgi:DNA-binding transcriptional regulator YhcF (GntR family)